MFDWLGLSPEITQMVGIAFIVIGVGILLSIGLYLFRRCRILKTSNHETQPKSLSLKKNEKENNKEVKEDAEISLKEDNFENEDGPLDLKENDSTTTVTKSRPQKTKSTVGKTKSLQKNKAEKNKKTSVPKK